ncbi:MAG: hypothetical protein AAGJ10_11390 [Bacteroidota bacterium]
MIPSCQSDGNVGEANVPKQVAHRLPNAGTVDQACHGRTKTLSGCTVAGLYVSCNGWVGESKRQALGMTYKQVGRSFDQSITRCRLLGFHKHERRIVMLASKVYAERISVLLWV